MIINVESNKTVGGANFYIEVSANGSINGKTFWMKSKSIEIDPAILNLMCTGLICQIAGTFIDEKEIVINYKNGNKFTDVMIDAVEDMILDRRLCYIEYLKREGVTFPKIEINFNSPILIPMIEPSNSIMTCFSFGKESHLNRRICKEEFSKIGVEWKGGLFVEVAGYLRSMWQSKYDKYDDLHPISSNFNHLTKFIRDCGSPVTTSRINYNLPFIFMSFAYSNRVKYFSVGNEYGCSFAATEDTSGDVFYFWDLFEETQHMELMCSMMMQSIIKDARLFSPLLPVKEDLIIKILHDKYREDYDLITACWYPSNKHRWCNVCDKCQMYRGVVLKLGINPPPELDIVNFRALDYDVDLLHHMSEYAWIPDELRNVLFEYFNQFNLVPDMERNPYTVFGNLEEWSVAEAATSLKIRDYSNQ